MLLNSRSDHVPSFVRNAPMVPHLFTVRANIYNGKDLQGPTISPPPCTPSIFLPSSTTLTLASGPLHRLLLMSGSFSSRHPHSLYFSFTPLFHCSNFTLSRDLLWISYLKLWTFFPFNLLSATQFFPLQHITICLTYFCHLSPTLGCMLYDHKNCVCFVHWCALCT